VISDGSDFGDRLLRGIHHSSKPLVNSFQHVCSGFYLIAEDLSELESLLSKLKRWARHRILCVLPAIAEQEFQNFLQTKVSLFRDAEVLVARTESPIGFQLTYTLRRFTPIMYHGVRWLRETGKGKQNFHGREIKVATFNCSTFSRINYPYLAGSEMAIFLEVVRRLNLTYKFIVPIGSRFPLGVLKDGLWHGGLLGLLASDEADVGFCGLWIANNKINTGVEMSVSLKRICMMYLVPRPVSINSEWYGIFSPYTTNLWLAIIVAYLSVSLLLPTLAYMDSLISVFGECRYLSFERSWILLAGMLLQGNWMRSTHSQGPCRHLIAWWTVFSLLIGSVFSGSLASYLTRAGYTWKPETIEDLLQTDYSWTTTRVPVVGTLFNLNDPVHQEWMRRIRVVRTQEELHGALRKLNNVVMGIYTFGIFSLMDEDISDDVLKGYEISSYCFTEFYLGFAFRRGSPYLKFFNEQLKNMIETGFIHYYMKTSMEETMKTKSYMYETTRLSKNSAHGSNLTLASLKGIIEFWVCGLLISTVVFFVELMSGPVLEYWRTSRFYRLKNSTSLFHTKNNVK
ncbi:Ionotropic receptor 116, partial [Halyomorpha halys]